MFQPEPSPYLQLPTGYAIPHGLPDYAFEETPLRLGDSRGAAAAAAAAVGADGPGSAAAAAAGGGGVLPMLYNVNGPPVFAGGSANSAGAGPAPSASGSFNFPIHATSPSTTAPTAASTVAVSAPSHHSSSLPLLVKMEPNAHDLVAQEAAARNYEPQFQVLYTTLALQISSPSLPLSPERNKKKETKKKKKEKKSPPCSPSSLALCLGTARRQEDAEHGDRGRICQGRPHLRAKDNGRRPLPVNRRMSCPSALQPARPADTRARCCPRRTLITARSRATATAAGGVSRTCHHTQRGG